MSTDSTSSRERFFESNYIALRDRTPMRWMTRLFLKLADGWHPELVDLPTGAGKTDVIIIWVLVLSWYGLQGAAAKPVPRRLVWVVNRRVLVQQVFRLAGRLQEKLGNGEDSEALSDIRAGLATLSGDADDIFRVVQLRGQLIDDREWSVAPSVPQLIIGTVDQIGSRLLFQGYSLGKWSRPLQAALLAIDAWVCVDEAHLVPAFVLTLRQLRNFTAPCGQSELAARSSVFDRLPFWTTELSATPALMTPKTDSVFSLIAGDDDDPALADRLLAARTRQVHIRWAEKDQKIGDAILRAAADLDGKAETVAVFVRTVGDANGIAKGLERRFKKRSLKITGRIRGYERERIEKDRIFQRFQPEEESEVGEAGETVFLVGTAAAEVGLDADAAAVVCDFASLPTLLQRLGRLDRRGRISRAFHSGRCDAPTMTILAKSDGSEAARQAKSERDIRRRILALAQALRHESNDYSVSQLVGAHWRTAIAKDGRDEAKDTASEDGQTEEVEPDKAKGIEPDALVDGATWRILLHGRQYAAASEQTAFSPYRWLKHPVSCVTGGPIAVPPLTAALIEHWSGTTNARDSFLPVHPFLYGLLPDDESTPLVGVAFRLEMDALFAIPPDEDQEEAENQDAISQVEEIFRLFPPRRAELHFVPIATARDWFASAEALEIPVAHFDGEEWSAAPDRQDPSLIHPGSVLILPTLASSYECLKKIVEDEDGVASRDVLEGVSTQRPAYWRRVVQVEPGDYRLNSADGAARIEQRSQSAQSDRPGSIALGDPTPGPIWQPRLRYRLKIGAALFRFEYLKPKRPVQRQFLDDSGETPGHLSRAEKDAARIAATVAPGNEFLRCLLIEAAKVHDEGKRNRKWQRAMGNRDYAHPVAKPLVQHPASMGGFRHEWESLLKMRANLPAAPDAISTVDAQQWRDLWYHLVASHHGHLRPWISDNGFAPEIGKERQSVLRVESAERFVRLQRIGPWRLAYLEALIKAADVASSQPDEEEDADEQ